MEEDTEFKKLPIEEQCVHKLWKARLNGYDETIKVFRQIDDEKSAEWNRFVYLLKKFVVDAHALAQERGLEATLICVENCAAAAKVASDVLAGVVQKCIAAQKTRTRELAVQVALMYVEVERQEQVVEELIKGMEHKNPKIVAACTTAATEALREFGHKVVAVKPLVKQIGRLLSDRDKTVRTEGKAMTVEIYRWIGDALKPQLAALPAVVVTELEAEFAKMGKEKPEPARFLKSAQAKAAALLGAAGNGAGDGAADGGGDEGDAEDADAEEMDPMDLIDPVDILARLPKDFYDKLEEKKWQTRKEALEALEEQLKNPKLAAGDYGELVKALKKVLSKDTNVVLVAMAGKSLASLARGLAKRFAPYAPVCVAAILEKFKEKKANVVAALRDAIDVIYPCTTLEAMQEDLLEALSNKNPSVKAETTQFLARAFARTQPAVFSSKKMLKAFVAALLKTLNESDPAVRDGSAEALGTLQKLLGEKALAAFVVDVDALKLAKVKECADKAVILVKTPVVKKAAAAPKVVAAKAEVKAAPAKPAASAAGNSGTIKRPATSALRKPAAGGAGKKAPAAAATSAAAKPAAAALPTERDLTPEEVVERAAELLPGNCMVELSDSNWKQRLAAAETILASIAAMADGDGAQPLEHSQVLCKVLCSQKPGLKDTNVQVVRLRLEAVQRVIETIGVSATTADGIVCDVTEKLGDAKNGAQAATVLSAMADRLHLQYVVGKVLGWAFEQKSPKVQSEALQWVTRAVQEFGMQVNPKVLIEDLRKAVGSTNPTVRQAAFAALGTLHLYTGDSLMMFFDSEKPAIKQQIQAEFDKNAGQKAPAPIRGPAARAKSSDDGQSIGGGGDGATEADNDDDDAAPAINLKDLLPRVDISGQITEALLAEISDKNWKTRNEGLVKLQGILNESKLIGPNIGDLPHALGQRLVDSNAKIAQTALAICQQLADVMGPPCRQYVRAFFPGFVNGLGDGKQFIRAASITCMNVWGDQCGYKEFFEAEMIAEALRAGSPALRAELWCWLAEKMPLLAPRSVSKDELVPCLPQLYMNICDRNADVRKHANDAVYGFMLHLGYEAMVKGLEKVKPSSKKDIQAALDKTRPNLPVKPLPKGRQQAPLLDEAGGRATSAKGGPNKIQKAASGVKLNQGANVSGGGSTAASATNAPAANGPAAAAARKKEEEVDTSPLLAVNNQKNQRMLDEQKLKVLKWNFTTPREEFIELLRDQMQAANVNKALLANMFHADFRYHLKAIDTLLEDLPANSRALICNLDLVLKWISLRFYDTNPSVLLKGLEYLHLVFNMLAEQQYDLAEAEGACFIPHLLIKIGDPKDTVRNGVRSIIRQICEVYPFTKVFSYTMDGLKSKNARQRTECLDELGSLIERYGINVCQPTPATALKEVARHIGDRDNSVRSAALNCIVQAHFLIGERVNKMIGNLSEKDTSMLEERIKRAMKARRAEAGPGEESGPLPAGTAAGGAANGNVSGGRSPPKSDRSGEFTEDDAEMEEQRDESVEADQVVQSPSPPRALVEPTTVTKVPKAPTGPFGLDPEVIGEIEKDWVRVGDQPAGPVLHDVDLSFLYSPLKTPEINGVAYPVSRLQLLMNSRRTHRGASGAAGSRGASPSSRPQSANLANELPKQLDAKLVRTIESIGHPSSILARSAMNEIHDILDCPEKHAALRDYEDIYIEAICQQFKHLSQQPTTDSLTMYQAVLSSIYTFFTAQTLGKNLSVESLKLMMSVLVGLMADNKLTTGEDGQYTKVLNGVCLRILERSNFSNLNCALIRLLKESCTHGGLPKFTELLMKCIWRTVKLMPDRTAELDYASILHEIHDFMTMLPSVWWAQRPVDTPLRTVKTIIHNVTKLKGKAILQYLNDIPVQSELHGYLLRVLKNINKEAKPLGAAADLPPPSQPSSTTQPDTKHISKETNEAMSAIFKQIATKSAAQAGIAQLYEYKKQHPDLDMAPFLYGANPVFLKFIEDGLADMESNDEERNTNSNTNAASAAAAATAADGAKVQQVLGESGQTNKDADYWMDRLKLLKNRSTIGGGADDNNENVHHHQQHAHHHPKFGAPHSTASDLAAKMSHHDRGGGPITGNRLELLQQKLSQIRQKKPA